MQRGTGSAVRVTDGDGAGRAGVDRPVSGVAPGAAHPVSDSAVSSAPASSGGVTFRRIFIGTAEDSRITVSAVTPCIEVSAG
ncbi:hypothetical protein Q0Z83_067400 [Actinoplanes sichuanensis]|nr:hypothetical protein Q0Z83_067400 [Actinoplanes sichuanensis]